MNKRNMIKVGLVVAMAAVPFHANAVSREAGLKACADAMVNNLAEEQGAPMVYNLDPESESGARKLGRREVFHLDALNPEGDEVVARMDCVVNKQAEVTKLIPVPLDAEDARIRATTFN